MLPPVVICPACGSDVQPFGDHCACEFCGHWFTVINGYQVDFDADEVDEDDGA